jgi:glycosyltransferase involved in cell wall biosynthesis
MRWFHSASSGVMVATQSLEDELEAHGFQNLKRWSRGVDLKLFRPQPKDLVPALNDLPRPIHMYVGRVAIEKNIKAFLEMDAKGSKVVVGDGPQMASLKKAHPDVIFVSAKKGEELAAHYAAADLFVFPSLTDTFGLVMLEAMACGVPVAAFPVPGPKDVVGIKGRGTRGGFSQQVGALDDDLSKAAERALQAKPEDCRAYALLHSWEACADLFAQHLVLAHNGAPAIETPAPQPAPA